MRKLVVGLLFLPFLLFSCNNDDYEPFRISLDKSQVIMHYDEEEQLDLIFSHELLNGFSYVWFSGDTNVVTVTQEGLVRGVRVGETVVTVLNEENALQATCLITIEPRSYLYKEPVLGFDKDVSFIKAKENRELILESAQQLIYQGENENVTRILYNFSNEGLTSINTFLTNEEKVTEEAFVFLTERYKCISILGEKEGIFVIDNESGINCFMVYNESVGYMIVYGRIQMEDSDTKSGANKLIYSLLEEFKYKPFELPEYR